ncbi:galactofuranose ABC transporter, permease protein YjfF [Crateriforma conspicua]|uniref:galactofuranose ABC transporter, permease protein YjfF n=1 Tax=Crateriforma conspicua TaxID=2527996 RepID=UPI0011889C1D|nr:galactofuranose ABC transporter, permease protein YjfF [Crateriforma conspicua]QDV63944.1 Inner membrane ABC transporter permease protein YjfF [Crateriforma conspicua]
MKVTGFLRLSPKVVPLLTTAFVLVLLLGGASSQFDGFASSYVMADLVSENAFLGIAALGMTLVILSGGIDLSVGSMIGFTTILVATLISDGRWSPVAAWIAALGIGTAFGGLMGMLVQVFRLPAFLVTLAGLFFARGMAFAIKKESVQINHPMYDRLNDLTLPIGGGAELSFGALVFLGMFLVTVVIAHFTRFGRNLYATGGSESSAVLMGLPVARTKIGVYTFSGFCASLAGIVMTLYMDSGNPANAMSLELDAIAVVVIGGTLLTGGIGFVPGTLLGVLIYSTIYQITYFSNLPASLARISIGILLMGFIILQRWLSRAR